MMTFSVVRPRHLLLLLLPFILAACVAPTPRQAVAPRDVAEKQLVYPAPPDEPRFVYERTIASNLDVVPEDKDSALKQALTGQTSKGEGIAKPYAVATYRGRIFVTDSVDRNVKVFDVPRSRYYKIGENAEITISQPLGIDIDDQGLVYVADATLKTVLVYDQEGKFLRKIGGQSFFQRLSSVTVDAKGERLYVVDIGGVTSDKHMVRVFNAVSGDHLFDIGRRGGGPGEFNLPRDVAIGKDGRIYVVDGGNFRVQIFDREGKHLKSFGSVGKQLGNFARPKEIAADKEGNVYVVDTAFGNFQIFNAEGELLMFVGERGSEPVPGKYMLPSGIAVDEDGRVYFVDQWFRKIDIFRPASLKSDQGYLGQRVPAPNTAKSGK